MQSKAKKTPNSLLSFEISAEEREKIIDKIVLDIESSSKNQDNGSFAMIPTYIVIDNPVNANGTALGIDFGGSNVRYYLEWHNSSCDGSPSVQTFQNQFELSDEILQKGHEEIFRYLAVNLAKFLNGIVNFHQEQPKTKVIKAGFGFSYPVQQSSKANGTLLGWTKKISQTEQNIDVVGAFQTAIDNALTNSHIKVEITSLLNDTTSTFLYFSQINPRINYLGIAAIFGTGTNSCIVDYVSSLSHKLSKEFIQSEEYKQAVAKKSKMIVNMESGGYRGAAIHDKITPYDCLQDYTDSEQRKGFIFEKMISGLYWPEILKNYLLKENPTILSKFSLNFAIDAKYMSIWALSTTFPDGLDNEEKDLLSKACHAIIKRAAIFAALMIIAIEKYLRRKQLFPVNEKIGLGIDGSLYTKSDVFRLAFNETLKKRSANVEIIGEDAQEASVKGAYYSVFY